MTNPLLSMTGLPPFSLIQPEHVKLLSSRQLMTAGLPWSKCWRLIHRQAGNQFVFRWLRLTIALAASGRR